MTLEAWGSAAALVAAALVIGRALNLLGLRCRPAAPAVGLAALIVVASVAIKLPGRAVTAAVALALLVIAGAIVIVRRGRRTRPPVTALVTLVIAAFGAAIPFIASGYVGLPGVSLDNDTANHLVWAEALRSPAVAARYGLPGGYPLGPHSLTAAVSSGLGVRLDMAMTGLLIATVLITALVGMAALPGERAWKKPIVGVLAALLYLPAAYYAEGSFKETLLGVLLLGMVLQLEGLRAAWNMSVRDRCLALMPVSILAAAAIYVYSYVAVAWIGGMLVIWGLAEAIVAPSWLRRWRTQLRVLAVPALIAGGVFVILLLPSAGRIASFASTIGISPSSTGAITASNLGNLAYPLSSFEAYGLWNSADFRLLPLPTALFHAGELGAFALGVLALGFFWSIRRREFILPAAVAACAIVYWRASHGQSPYVSAKALAIAGPVVAVTQLRGLLRTPVPPLSAWTATARFVAAIAFVFLAARSSLLALRSEPVWAPESTRQLLALDELTHGQSLLFLGNSDYAPWIFSDTNMSALAPDTISMGQAVPRPTKPNLYGTPYDFDSVTAATLNRFSWVITSTTAYESEAPAGFVLARQLPMYQLWHRVGTVAPREVIEPPGAPGAVLDCRSRAGRQLSHERGVAAVMTTPVAAKLSAILPGGVDTATLAVPAGRWDVSLQYTSPAPLEVSAAGRRWRIPAYTDRPGPFFTIGSIVTTGRPVIVTVRSIKPSSLTGPLLASLPMQIAALPSRDPRTLMSLRKACGRYVDWFRLTP